VTGLFFLSALSLKAQVWQTPKTTVTAVAKDGANNSVNAVVFRKKLLVTFNGTQYIAYYDNDRYVVVGKRKSGSNKWGQGRANTRAMLPMHIT